MSCSSVTITYAPQGEEIVEGWLRRRLHSEIGAFKTALSRHRERDEITLKLEGWLNELVTGFHQRKDEKTLCESAIHKLNDILIDPKTGAPLSDCPVFVDGKVYNRASLSGKRVALISHGVVEEAIKWREKYGVYRLHLEIEEFGKAIALYGQTDRMTGKIIEWLERLKRTFKEEKEEHAVLDAYIPRLQKILVDAETAAPLNDPVLFNGEARERQVLAIGLLFAGDDPIDVAHIPTHKVGEQAIKWLKGYNKHIHDKKVQELLDHLIPKQTESSSERKARLRKEQLEAEAEDEEDALEVEEEMIASLQADFLARHREEDERIEAHAEEMRAGLAALQELLARNAEAVDVDKEILYRLLENMSQKNKEFFIRIQERLSGVLQEGLNLGEKVDDFTEKREEGRRILIESDRKQLQAIGEALRSIQTKIDRLKVVEKELEEQYIRLARNLSVQKGKIESLKQEAAQIQVQIDENRRQDESGTILSICALVVGIAISYFVPGSGAYVMPAAGGFVAGTSGKH